MTAMNSDGPRYILAPGTQVREEDFGLLFYTMAGPRLYFVSSGELLGTCFFHGKHTMRQWIGKKFAGRVPHKRLAEAERMLGELSRKGVIIEC